MEEQIRELTLLLIYLTAWNEKDRFVKNGILTSWSGYEHSVLNEFEEKEYFWKSGNNKKLHLTPEGIDEIEKILKKYNFIMRNETVDKYGFENVFELKEKIRSNEIIDKSTDKIISELGQTIMDLSNQSYNFFKPEVDEIIADEVIDDERVERALEGLLNCFPTTETEELFNRLCDYYESRNKELVYEMKAYHRDLYDDEE